VPRGLGAAVCGMAGIGLVMHNPQETAPGLSAECRLFAAGLMLGSSFMCMAVKSFPASHDPTHKTTTLLKEVRDKAKTLFLGQVLWVYSPTVIASICYRTASLRFSTIYALVPF
jgi:zinc transporter ZupT